MASIFKGKANTKRSTSAQKTRPKKSREFSMVGDTDDMTEQTPDQGRHSWAKKSEYVMTAVGYCVGLGNVWRFPYVCMRNGGGAFLIPFVLSLFVCALPVFLLEAAMGQFLGKSSWHAWNICPLFKGIGISMNMLSLMMTWYYAMILGWCVIYMVNSFKSPLPWTRCDQDWNSPLCIDSNKFYSKNHTRHTNPLSHYLIAKNYSDVGVNFSLRTNLHRLPSDSIMLQALKSSFNTTALLDSVNATVLTENGTVPGTAAAPFGVLVESNATSIGGTNASVLIDGRISSTKEFWLHNVLELSSGLNDIGGLPWHTSVSLAVANLVVLLAIIKGIKSSGKVVYVTATLPYLLLTVILILGCTLEGSGDGVLFYIKPDFSKLLKLQTWVEAAIQVFYSLGPGWGGLITMASYNKFNNNCLRDSILLTICCEGTSIFGGFAIFTILGHMAHNAGVPILEFTKSGPGLAFIVYPHAISLLPLPQLWGFLFFLMLFTLGLDSQFTNVETVMTTLADVWPKFVLKWRKSISTCVMGLLTVFGLAFACRGGIYLFTLMDWYIAAFTLLPQAALECIIVAWIYGTDKFCRDIELMIGRAVPFIFVLAWKFITPALLMILFCITLVFYKPPTYEGTRYPIGAEVGGWLFAISPFMAIVVCAAFQIKSQRGSFLERIRRACRPAKDWTPSHPEIREKYDYQLTGIHG